MDNRSANPSRRAAVFPKEQETVSTTAFNDLNRFSLGLSGEKSCSTRIVSIQRWKRGKVNFRSADLVVVVAAVLKGQSMKASRTKKEKVQFGHSDAKCGRSTLKRSRLDDAQFSRILTQAVSFSCRFRFSWMQPIKL